MTRGRCWVLLSLSRELFAMLVLEEGFVFVFGSPARARCERLTRAERPARREMRPARPGTKMLVADVIKCVATRNEERDNRDEKNSVGAIAMCAPRIFHVQWNKRTDEQERSRGEQAMDSERPCFRWRRTEIVLACGQNSEAMPKARRSRRRRKGWYRTRIYADG